MQKRIIYQLLPRLYSNTCGNNIPGGSLADNGTGKFSGITAERLRFLRDRLHVTDVWYTGVIDHATMESFEGFPDSSPQIVKGRAGSPYAIRNYFDIAPYLADKQDERIDEFKQLISRTHEAGMRVLIDFVPNHVARQYDSRNRWNLGKDDDTSVAWAMDNDFFYCPSQELTLPLPQGTVQTYREYPAKATGNDCFNPHPSVNDWFETVKINYCSSYNPTWEKMAAAIRFWLSLGVDGFRCDMVELVPPEFFRWLIASVRRERPDVTFIAEVYRKELYGKYLREVGFDLLYDKSGLYDTLRGILCEGGSVRGITAAWQQLGDLQGGMLNFLENHDEQRIASGYFCGEARKSFAALGVSALLNNSAFMIYSGQEYGERGMDSEGYSGTDGRTTIFDWWAPQSLRRAAAGCLLEHEEKILGRYLRLAEEIHSSEALSGGRTYDLNYACPASRHFDPDRHFAFLRSAPSDTRLVVANFTPMPSEILVRIPSHAFEWLGQGPKEDVDIKVQVDGNDYAIVKL